MSTHKAGFVSIVGKPNVGKSTLMNRLIGENLSIVTAKAQTTRHRIMGILQGADFQIVYSDTPGLLEPRYALHEAMMHYVKVSLEDADAILMVVEWGESFDEQLHSRVQKTAAPIILVVNKTDLGQSSAWPEKKKYWEDRIHPRAVVGISALKGQGIQELLPLLLSLLPVHPAYFPKDEFTTRSERFFASEIIREKVFLNYSQEVPYSTEVVIESFKDEEKILRIRATLYVERTSQKGIVIGHQGSALKKTGTEARLALEQFFAKKVFLELFVKVADNWRKLPTKVRHFGYEN